MDKIGFITWKMNLFEVHYEQFSLESWLLKINKQNMESIMENKEKLDFSVKEIKVANSGMDNSNVQSGCWGQGGGDTRNLC